ncbi:MAG: hypothetical protein ABI112_17870 [Terracoccus sp.]
MTGVRSAYYGPSSGARSKSSLAARRMLHSELTIVLHSHRDW